MKQEVLQGQTDYTIFILVRDTSGNAKTGLTNASGGIDVAYARVETDNDVTTTAGAVVALATPALTDVHLDWGFLEVDATNHPGLYRFDMADGVFASGAWSSVVTLIGTGLEPSHCEFVLIPSRPYDGVQLQTTHAAVTFATLSVTGQMDAGNLLVDSTVAVGTTTTLSGNVSCAGTFDVVGAVTAGSVSIDAGFDVVGALSANSFLIDTTTTLTGAVSCGAAFDVVGELSANSILVDIGTVLTGAVTTGAITAASLSITGQLDAGNVLVDGATVLTGALGVGATTLASLAITGDASVGTTTTLTGNVSMGGTFDIVGAFSANSVLVDTTTTLTGAVELSSTLGIVGITTFTGAVILSSTLATGAVTLNALTVSNLTTLTGNVSLGGTLGITGTTTYTGNVSYADGITVAAPSTLNRGGIDVTGNGTGPGVSVAGGATGHGISAVSGGTGDGIYAHSATTGHGLHCVGGGVAGDGIHADGDTNGDGITAVGVGAGQYDINADIHGTIDTVTTNTDLVTAASVVTAMEADGGDLSSLMEALVNRLLITELNGNAQIFNDAGAAQGIVLAAFTSVAGVTQRKRMVI